MVSSSQRSAVLGAIGAAVKKRREELHMSQEQLASASSVHRTYISDVERGVRNVSVLTLSKISDALDVPLALLFIGLTTSAQAKR